MKNKKNVFLFIIIFIFVFISIFFNYKNTKKDIEADISIMREVYFDTISITKIDFNNYSADINFNELSSSKNTHDFWVNSMTSNYISSFDSNKLILKKSKENIEKYFVDLNNLHKVQIDFLLNNRIPVDKIESSEYKNGESFEKNISDNISKLEKKFDSISSKIKDNLDLYIKYINKYGINQNLNKEVEDYKKYFKSEYESLLEKRFTEKLNRIIKKEL